LKQFILVILGIILCTALQAQDKIHFLDGRIQKAKVIEIGLKEIRYKKFSNLNGPNYVVLKTDLKKIEYENGSEDIFSSEETSQDQGPNNYEKANKIELPKNPRLARQIGISGVLLGPSVIGSVQLDLFLNENWQMDLGLGLVGIYGGLNYHFKGKDMHRMLTPYVGLKGHIGFSPVDFAFNPRTGLGFYVPVGVSLVSKGMIYFAPELALHYAFLPGNGWFRDEHVVAPFGALKLGLRF